MLAITSSPWIIQRLGRSMIHIFGATSPETGDREVVCIVNSVSMEANAALICAAPPMATAVLAGDLHAARRALIDAGLA